MKSIPLEKKKTVKSFNNIMDTVRKRFLNGILLCIINEPISNYIFIYIIYISRN